ncbi:MAG: M20/M25/M40 family metallo-hydrolase, partial [Peptococcaceae bacterium]|nr:M20/M25/M40 family metallo-hydrolase [Peptococcaceae bacterium]
MNIVVGFVAAILALLLVLVIKTALLAPTSAKDAKVVLDDSARAEQYGKVLSQMVQKETISSRNQEDRSKFEAFHAVLEELFPHVHATCEKHSFNGSLLYKWQGNGEGEPILLMSHLDVVEGNGIWEHEPFSGDIDEKGRVWGRGTVDTKASLFCIFEAVEELIAGGYVPNCDVYIASSCTEEWSGDGAPSTVQYLAAQNIRLRLVLDEGGFVFRDADRMEYGRAANLKELEKMMREVPDDILLANTSKNMFSKWFLARGLFTLGVKFKTVSESHFATVEDLRDYVSQQIHDFHALTGRGVIARFDADNYGRHIWFSRMGEGSLGGKARGLAFLNSMVYKHNLASKYDNVKISIPRTVVIATDYFDQFIVENDLQYVIDSDISDEEILSEFVAARLPEELMDQLRVYVDSVRSPLAVRSSSKLEDSSYQPFAGVYSTYMIPLVENRNQMLRMLGKAIKSVYASVFYSGSRTYIQTTANLLSEEKMAVVVQSICGSEHEGLYYPMMSGVARSVNFY